MFVPQEAFRVSKKHELSGLGQFRGLSQAVGVLGVWGGEALIHCDRFTNEHQEYLNMCRGTDFRPPVGVGERRTG